MPQTTQMPPIVAGWAHIEAEVEAVTTGAEATVGGRGAAAAAAVLFVVVAAAASSSSSPSTLLRFDAPLPFPCSGSEDPHSSSSSSAAARSAESSSDEGEVMFFGEIDGERSNDVSLFFRAVCASSLASALALHKMIARQSEQLARAAKG